MDPVDRPWIVGPRGPGGVSAVLDLVVPRLDAVRVDSDAAFRLLPWHRGLVHLHTSLRPRAFARDTVLCLLARGPRVVSWHGWDPELARRVGRSVAWRQGFARGLGSAEAHLVLTDEQRSALIAWGVDPGRIRKIANPVDPVRVARVAGPPTVLFLGRLERAKGVVELVRAFGMAAPSEPDLRLVVAGAGPARSDVVAAIGRSGAADRVALAGWVGGVERSRLLARASVLALPSRGESFPLAVAEALVAEVPVVATRTGAIPELVGTAGVLLASADPDLLADALVAVVRSPPSVRAAAARVREWCDPARVADHWRSAWEEAERS